VQEFESMRARWFAPFCQRLDLVPGETDTGPCYAMASAASGWVRIFFEYERGMCSFAVGVVQDARPLCGVEEIAGRFPRVRLMAEGAQRLSLEEQQQFLESRWGDLQVIFSPEHLAETRQWQKAANAACTAQFSKKI